MLRGCTIRSELMPNREDRASYKRRLQKNAFGIYRPLSEESRHDIVSVLESSQEKVDEYFGNSNSRYTKLIIPKDHGITFVQRGNVVRALKTSAMRNFNLSCLQKRISDYNYAYPEQPEVEINDFDWYGGDLKLVGKFAIAGMANEFEAESEIFEGFLHEAGSAPIDVYVPDHTSLCRFRRSRNGHHLNDEQRRNVKNIVRAEFREAGIGSVALDQVVLGDGSYREPLQQAA